jgi:hypothetical protein
MRETFRRLGGNGDSEECDLEKSDSSRFGDWLIVWRRLCRKANRV